MYMYENLEKILNAKKITKKAYADFLGVAEKTVQNKLAGKTEFTLGEATKTCMFICPEYKLEYVFEKTEELAEVGEEAAPGSGMLAMATA